MSNNKMKGLLKGLRYISQIFDNDKEPEMQIGFPTDVKHLAHIGPDGASMNSPSWINKFKSSSYASAPLSVNEDINENGSIKWVSQDSSSRSSTRKPNSGEQGMSDMPRSSRQQSTGSAAESPTREKSDKPKQSRRSSRTIANESPDGSTLSLNHHQKDSSQGNESPSNLPDIPKKSRRKKSKDSSAGRGGGSSSSLRSSRTSRTQGSEVDGGLESGLVSNSLNNEQCHTSALSSLEEGEENGFTIIS